MCSQHNYLEVPEECDPIKRLFGQIIVERSEASADCGNDCGNDWTAALCVKTKQTNRRKLFVNICHSNEIKSPTLDLSEDELRSLLASEDANAFTIPMLIKPICETKDKKGENGRVCDVVISSDFYVNKVVNSELFKTFLIIATLETIEKDKYDCKIDKNNWIVLKNKKYQEKVANHSVKHNDVKSLVNEMNDILNIEDNEDCDALLSVVPKPI